MNALLKVLVGALLSYCIYKFAVYAGYLLWLRSTIQPAAPEVYTTEMGNVIGGQVTVLPNYSGL